MGRVEKIQKEYEKRIKKKEHMKKKRMKAIGSKFSYTKLPKEEKDYLDYVNSNRKKL